MSIKVTYDASGFRELESALRDLRKEMGGKEGNIVRKSLLKASYPVWREAQTRAPVSDPEMGAYTPIKFLKSGKAKADYQAIKKEPGMLRKSIKRIVHRNPRGWNELVGLGVFLPPGTTRENPLGAYYANWVEFGTDRMKAQPFLRPAFENNSAQMVRDFGTAAGAAIEKAAAKIGKRYAGISNNSRNRVRMKGRL